MISYLSPIIIISCRFGDSLNCLPEFKEVTWLRKDLFRGYLSGICYSHRDHSE